MNDKPVPFTVYGSTECDDTQRVQARLAEWGVRCRAVNIDHDPEAERFVIFVNGGYRSTPTLVFDAGKAKTIFTEPSDSELEELLQRMGYAVDGSISPRSE
jgi:mycoredoxin